MHYHKIINVSTVVPYFQIVFYKMVEAVHVKIGKYLTG
jgi:hypothetical protein